MMMPNRPHSFVHIGRAGPASHNNGRHIKITVYRTVAQAGLTEIGTIHCYAARQVATALAAAQTLVQTAQPLTPIQVIVLARFRQEFLRTVLLSVQVAGMTIINELKHKRPLSQGSRQQRQHIDQLVARYIHQVHMSLRR